MSARRRLAAADRLTPVEAVYSFACGFGFMAALIGGGWLVGRYVRKWMT